MVPFVATDADALPTVMSRPIGASWDTLISMAGASPVAKKEPPKGVPEAETDAAMAKTARALYARAAMATTEMTGLRGRDN